VAAAQIDMPETHMPVPGGPPGRYFNVSKAREMHPIKPLAGSSRGKLPIVFSTSLLEMFAAEEAGERVLAPGA
jgi:hypothetical protein